MDIKGDNLAYIIYTSGTTGLPKGVLGLHKGLSNRLQWMQAQYALTSKDTVLSKSPWTFDVSLWEMFWPLTSGAKLVLLEPAKRTDFKNIYRLILRQNITHIQFVPSLMNQFFGHIVETNKLPLKKVFSGGESLSPKLKILFHQKFGDHVELHNIYAPTEVFSPLFHRCDVATDHVDCIGKPSHGTKAYVLGEDLRPVHQNEIGELYLTGIGVARGYLNQEKLTKEKFIDDFIDPNNKAKLYKTGDLARYLPDNSIEYIGRKDNQVKIFGVRIELEEIESLLNKHPNVERSIVLLKNALHNKNLEAYYTLINSNKKISAQKLRNYLSKFLPSYMLPSNFYLLGQFPLTKNVKFDRESLCTTKDLISYNKDSHTSLQNNSLTLIQNIVARILGLSPSEVIEDFSFNNFTSLQMMQLHFHLSEILPQDLNIAEIFDFNNVKSFAEYLHSKMHASESQKREKVCSKRPANKQVLKKQRITRIRGLIKKSKG